MQKCSDFVPRSTALALAITAFAAVTSSRVLAAGGVTFLDLAADPSSGLSFAHTEPPRKAILEGFKATFLRIPDELPFVPHKPNGAPGVAILDFDRDGDLDIFVTNSAGGANALFSSQLRETGSLRFVDVAAAAGVDAPDHDATGVCYGDTDNDGDHDLLVLGAIEPNRFYENQGDGTFADASATAGIGGGHLSTSSCSMGDVDNDGLLDIAVANTHTDWTNLLGIIVPYDFSEGNQLFKNLGGNVFEDVSATSGILDLAALPPGAAALTWAVALADYDLDGDVDLFSFDDQGGVPTPADGGLSYGLIHLQENDGSGHFTDVTVEAGLAVPGSWMGVAFGDFNCDRELDFFATNLGDFPGRNDTPISPLGRLASRWFLQRGDGTFSDPGVGPLVATVFGWGTAAIDYDNDGDQDIVHHGALNLGRHIAGSNPGVILENQGCSATFRRDAQALAGGADHGRRVGQGLAAGDLDDDGFLDLVTVSNADIPPSVPLTPLSYAPGSEFDDQVATITFFEPGEPGTEVWNGLEEVDGSLAVEISSGGNGNESVLVTALGTVGITSQGRVNRDGIGAVFSFETPGGKSSIVPVQGGSSYASQHALAAHFGFGSERHGGRIEVRWPGGTRNRLLFVKAGERLVFPEIPCDLDRAFEDRSQYVSCVIEALDELSDAGILSRSQQLRFLLSALLP